MRVRPPSRAAASTAPWGPSVSAGGRSCSRSRSASVVSRVPEPGPRSNQVAARGSWLRPGARHRIESRCHVAQSSRGRDHWILRSRDDQCHPDLPGDLPAGRLNAAIVEGDSFHRYDRGEMQLAMAEADLNLHFSHFGPEANLLAELESLFRDYGRSAGGTGTQTSARRDRGQVLRIGTGGHSPRGRSCRRVATCCSTRVCTVRRSPAPSMWHGTRICSWAWCRL